MKNQPVYIKGAPALPEGYFYTVAFDEYIGVPRVYIKRQARWLFFRWTRTVAKCFSFEEYGGLAIAAQVAKNRAGL